MNGESSYYGQPLDPLGDLPRALGPVDLHANLVEVDAGCERVAVLVAAVPAQLVPAHAQVARLESEIDAMNARLEPLRSFVLPGGSALSAALHLCRTVARRAERHTVALATVEDVNEHAVTYLNRLSDWFFVAARIANEEGRADVLWVPGAHR